MREYAQTVIWRLPARLLSPHRRQPRAAAFAGSIACVAICTALIFPLREIAPPVSAGVVYMLGVLVVSTLWGVRLGIFTALLSTVAFNFFHIPPIETFDVAKSGDWVALGVFLVVALIASSLAELSRVTIETEALRRSDELKTALLRAVSHDLRSPLTAIRAAAEALASRRIEDGDRRALAGAVSAEALRLSSLVDKLLDLSRLEAGQARPHHDWCSIDEVVTTAIENLGERGDRVDAVLPHDLPFVRADAAQLERAVANLLDNAVRFSGRERVKVVAQALGSRIAVRVIDRGPGIPAADLERVFEPFYQRSDDRRYEGSGLGLAIAQGFVDVNGGQIRAESVPGQGTTFAIELPLDQPAEPRPAALREGR
jgi:K+-sensing histidine kinase KdpD